MRGADGTRWPRSRKLNPFAQAPPPVVELRQGQATLLAELPGRVPRCWFFCFGYKLAGNFACPLAIRRISMPSTVDGN